MTVKYAVHNGTDVADANWNQQQLPVALHHVRSAISGNANPFGSYNMAGNVWEWIADNYEAPYNTSPATDPFIEVNGSTLRCWRGGSWNYHEATLQSAIRFSDEEDRGNDHFGFRIAGENTSTGLLKEIKGEGFEIYPNPSNSFVNVSLSNDKISEINIYTMSGKLIQSQLVQNGTKLNLGNLEKGIYLVKLEGKYQKLIIQ